MYHIQGRSNRRTFCPKFLVFFFSQFCFLPDFPVFSPTYVNAHNFTRNACLYCSVTCRLVCQCGHSNICCNWFIVHLVRIWNDSKQHYYYLIVLLFASFVLHENKVGVLVAATKERERLGFKLLRPEWRVGKRNLAGLLFMTICKNERVAFFEKMIFA